MFVRTVFVFPLLRSSSVEFARQEAHLAAHFSPFLYFFSFSFSFSISFFFFFFSFSLLFAFSRSNSYTKRQLSSSRLLAAFVCLSPRNNKALELTI